MLDQPEALMRLRSHPIVGPVLMRAGVDALLQDLPLGQVAVPYAPWAGGQEQREASASATAMPSSANAACGEDLETTVYAGLNQPRLLASNSVALGEAKNQMQRENKQRRQVLRAEQPLIFPWTQHQGLMDTITPTDHTACPPH